MKALKAIGGAIVCLSLLVSVAVAQLPVEDGPVYWQGQEWPIQPGSRVVSGRVYYPGGRLANVGPSTGLCMTLHNWGGTGWEGTANPVYIANYLNCVTLTVDYLQSGQAAFGPAPYDHGPYQAVDVIRGLWFVGFSLQGQGKTFDWQRIIGIGGSGGGNVMAMAHRLMPRTLSALVLMSAPMKPKFAPPLDSRWGALPPNEFRIRDLTDGPLTAITRSLDEAVIRMIHGRNDAVVPYSDAVAGASAMGASLLTVEPWGLWGPYQDAGHSIGDRTAIALHEFQMPLYSARRTGLTDFHRNDNLVRYPVAGGTWGMSYNGIPTLLWLP